MQYGIKKMAKTSTTTRLAYQNEIQSWYTKSFIISSLDFLKVTFVQADMEKTLKLWVGAVS